MSGHRKAPPNCYWRGDTLWGRIKVRGVEYRASLRTDDPKQARGRLAGWRKEIERQQALAGIERFTFKEAVVRWLEVHLPRQVKPAVVERYKVSIRALDPHFGECHLDEIDQRKIARFIESRTTTVTNATVRRDITALSQLLAAARSWGWIEYNVAAGLDLSQVRERREPITLPAEEDIQRVLDAAPPRMAALLRLLDLTGMRENEAVRLQRAAIDWADRTITLIHTKTNRPRAIRWETPGGDAGPVLRSLDLSDDSPFLFPLDASGKPYQNFSSNFGRVIRAVAEKCAKEGVPFRRWRVHDLRHRFAVRALRSGMGIYHLQQHLGHRSIVTTEIYLDFLPPDLRERARAGVAQKVAHTMDVAQPTFEKS
jgi:integrase/recombinase XerD